MQSKFRFFIAITALLITMAGTAQNNIRLISATDDEIVLNININDWELKLAETSEISGALLISDGAHAIREQGAPDVPRFVRSLIIPDAVRMDLEVQIIQTKLIDDVDIIPSKGHFLRSQNPDSIPYILGTPYSENDYYPGTVARLNEPYILRDFRGQTLEIYPFQYNPVTRKLLIYTEMQIRIFSTGELGKNALVRSRAENSLTREFDDIYNRHFINYSNNLRYTPLAEEGKMLIICHDQFMSAMQPFVHWKNTIGLSTEMVGTSATGTTPASIKNYIASYYNVNNLVFVLFVGDAEQIPPYTQGIIEGYSDNAYGYLAGSDRYQEIFVGRFSAQNISQVQTQVQRSIEYEQAYNFTNGWLHHGLGIARNEGAGGGHNGGEADYVHMDLIRNKLLSYNYDVVYREYDGNVPGLTNTTAALISQRINGGVSIINYCNHGSVTGWSVANYNSTHVDALTNVKKLPFIWAVACVNGQFQGTTCFAETWLRATDNQGEPTGAVAVFMSTINQPWTPPMDAQDEFNDILIGSYVNNIKRTYGGLSVNGVFKMLDLNPNTYGYRTAETWTIFGDPSLKVRTDNAIAMIVDHEPYITEGFSTLEITCNTPGAYAAITRNGNIISTAPELNGYINLNTEELQTGDVVTLAITAYNRIPYLTQLEVIAAGPYANFTASTISPATGETVIFTDASGGGNFSSWEWNFGEGASPATASGQGPHEVTYLTPGGKTVSLTVDGIYEREKVNYILVKDWYTLTLNIIGSGSVSVDGIPYTEPLSIREGSTVSLHAYGSEFTTFTNWSGDVTGAGNPCNLLMNSNKTVTANFALLATSTFTTGDIPTDSNFTTLTGNSSCPGNLSVNIPVGATITSVDVSYNMTAQNVGWMSEQRSQLRCVSAGGTSEPVLASGSGTTAGTFFYNRTGLTIANGVVGGGQINFQLHAGRTWSTTGYSGCTTYNNKVDNNTWTIKVYYLPPVVSPVVETYEPADITAGSVILGGLIISDGGAQILDKGIFWSYEPDPEITGTQLSLGSGPAAFAGELDGLTCKTNVYAKAYATNIAGTGYGQLVQFTTSICSDLHLEDMAIIAPETVCFDATETIMLAGEGKYFIVDPFAEVEVVAGEKILILEGTHIHENGYFLARIAIGDDYCGNRGSILASQEDKTDPNKESLPEINEAGFKVFPNPTSGIINIEINGYSESQSYFLVVYDLIGKPVRQIVFADEKVISIDISDQPRGMYLLKLAGTDFLKSWKVILR